MVKLREIAATLFIEKFYFWTLKRIYDTHIHDIQEKNMKAKDITGESFLDFEQDKIDYQIQTTKEDFPPLYVLHQGLAITIINNKVIRDFHTKERKKLTELKDQHTHTPYHSSPYMSLDLKRIFEIIQQHFGTDVVRIFQMVSTGIKNEEIAQELGIPLSTVKTKIRRTRIFLKNLNA